MSCTRRSEDCEWGYSKVRRHIEVCCGKTRPFPLYCALVLALIPGFLTGLSLIIAIGAQNAFVIRQGLMRQQVLLIVAICAISDAALIFLGNRWARNSHSEQAITPRIHPLVWRHLPNLVWNQKPSLRFQEPKSQRWRRFCNQQEQDCCHMPSADISQSACLFRYGDSARQYCQSI
jgi:hypothetical protein